MVIIDTDQASLGHRLHSFCVNARNGLLLSSNVCYCNHNASND